MELYLKLIRPSGNTTPFFYEVEEDMIAGVSALRNYFISKGLCQVDDTISDDQLSYTRTVSFESQAKYVAFRRVMTERYPSYTTVREAYNEDNGHEAEFSISEQIEEKYLEPDEETKNEIRAIIAAL